jgi:hypothetical protein
LVHDFGVAECDCPLLSRPEKPSIAACEKGDISVIGSLTADGAELIPSTMAATPLSRSRLNLPQSHRGRDSNPRRR